MFTRAITNAATLISIVLSAFLLGACQASNPHPIARVTLVLPESFHGDLFIVSGSPSDPKCEGKLAVPADGIVYISNFSDVSNFGRNAFFAATAGGKPIPSSLHVDAIGPRLLWPVGKMDDSLLYFVVGSLDEKIRLSAAKERIWPEIVQQLHSREK
jgi:hypothetical protein